MKGFQVRFPSFSKTLPKQQKKTNKAFPTFLGKQPTEEFAIYLNYVRKLGFEETPDYDFLRELFTKVLKNSGETEDGIYDWMLLNNGKGWEAGTVSFLLFSRARSEMVGGEERDGGNDLLMFLFPNYYLSPATTVLLPISPTCPPAHSSTTPQSSSNLLASANPANDSSRQHRSGPPRDRERERAERHALRAQAAAAQAAQNGNPSGVLAPSPALLRDGSKTGKNPSGSATPNANSSAMAVKGVGPMNSSPSGGAGGKRASQGPHPYASAGTAPGGYDSNRGAGGQTDGGDEYSTGGGGYRSGQASAVPPMNAATGGHGVGNGGGANYDHEDREGGFSLVRFLTCRCG